MYAAIVHTALLLGLGLSMGGILWCLIFDDDNPPAG